jgi:hypothetical protein
VIFVKEVALMIRTPLDMTVQPAPLESRIEEPGEPARDRIALIPSSRLRPPRTCTPGALILRANAYRLGVRSQAHRSE